MAHSGSSKAQSFYKVNSGNAQVAIRKGKRDLFSVPVAKCYVSLFHLGKTNLDLWFFCKIIQLVAAEQLLHASVLHLTYASCDVWLTMHQAISACLTSKILKFFLLSFIFASLVAELCLTVESNEWPGWIKGLMQGCAAKDRGWSRAKKPTR